MKAYAIQRNIRVSPRKAKLVVDLIRGKKVEQASTILENTNKKTAPLLLKLLKSAIANATNNHRLNGSRLYVYEVFAEQGKRLKRRMPRAKGSSDLITKPLTTLRIVLSDDPKQREYDLALIKEQVSKRVNGQKAAKAKLAAQQEKEAA